MTTPDVQVTGLYWTLAGPVEVGTGREWSLFDLRERCEEAARAGFSGIQLWHADLEHVLATGSLREIKQILDDNGLACTDRAHHVKVGNLFGTPCAIGRVADEFALLCADAARQTAAKVVYEFMPFDANANTLDTALVVGADAGNGGLAIDTWHMGKLGIAAADLGRIPRCTCRGSS